MKSKYAYRLLKEGYEHLGTNIIAANTKDELIGELLNFIWMTSGYYEEDE